jgi:16S rRNA (guanine966-N2)-methyltransferase
MRITGGIWRGRALRVPASGVRPSQDLLRQGLFSSLGAAVAGARVLDVFAGTGALGLEALSRGAAHAAWVERDPKAFAILRGNVEMLCGARSDGAVLVRGDATHPAVLERAGRDFDFVFADPPYAASAEAGLGVRLMEILAGPILRPGGWFVLEDASNAPEIAPPAGWGKIRERRCGDSRWTLFQKTAGAEDGTGGSRAPGTGTQCFPSR